MNEMKMIIIGLLSNRLLITALVAMFTAQVIKVVYYLIVEKKINWIHMFEAGGMPSSHSALVCSLVMMVGLAEGFESIIFAVVAVFAAIVMYDAIQVRHEDVGHTLVEVSAGGILGIFVSIISYLFY
jgi:hypothetical protein